MATPDIERRLAAAIEAGGLTPVQETDQELVDAFAAYQELESLFAVQIDSPTEDAETHEGGVDPPAQIDRFLIRRKLGQGAFGTVYLADDPPAIPGEAENALKLMSKR